MFRLGGASAGAFPRAFEAEEKHERCSCAVFGRDRTAIDLSNKDVCETDEQKKAKEGLLRMGRRRPGAHL